MNKLNFFAVTELDIDPKITEFFIWIYVLLFVVGIGMLIWNIITAKIKNRTIQNVADRAIQFDSVKSIIYRNHRQLNIPDQSLEYYVCKLVFEEQDEPQLDLNVLEAAGKYDNDDPRAVEQAVRRVNKKAKDSLELKNDLLLRRKEKTFLNDIERLV